MHVVAVALVAVLSCSFPLQMALAAVSGTPEWLMLSGYLQSTYRQSVHKEEPLQALQRIWLEAEVNRGGMLRGFVSGYLDADLSVYGRKNSDEPVFLPEVGEAYLTLDTEHVDVIAGLQKIRWGEADSMSTFDIINPIDYRNPVATARSASRLAVGAVDVRMDFFGLGVFDAVMVPVPRFSRLPEHKAPWEEKGLKDMRNYGDAGLVVRDDDNGPHSPEFAGRLKFYRPGYDFAFLFYRGYEHAPRYVASLDRASMRPKIASEYDMYEAYGFSLAASFWDSTLRYEFAAKTHYPFQSTNIDVERRTDCQTIIGWDRTFLTNLNVNLQAFFFSYDGSKVPGKDRNRYGYTFSIQDKFFDEALTAGFRGQVFANNGDYICELFAEYEYNDNVKFNAGYMFIGGTPRSDFGQFDQNDHLYIGIKYSF